MARQTKRLNANTLHALAAGRRHHDGAGLYLVVGNGSARSWIFRYMLGGKSHDVGLGSLEQVSLAAARKAAHEKRSALYAGNNPFLSRQVARQEVRAAVKASVSFAEAAERYLASGRVKPGQVGQWRQTLTDYAFPIIGKLAVEAVDVPAVHKVLVQEVATGESLWQARGETASRLRGRIEAVLASATALGLRQGDNPASWRGCLDTVLPKPPGARDRAHHAALPFAEIAGFMVELRQWEGSAARALEFAILTAARTSEALAARWDEIDLEAAVWVIPAERMKAGREHRVPLSDDALAVLGAMAEIQPYSEFVFPGRGFKLQGPQAMLRLVKKLRPEADLTTHGFRSTFASWVASQTSFAAEVREASLAHVNKDAVAAAYQRDDLLDKRRPLMDAWAAECGAQDRPKPRLVARR